MIIRQIRGNTKQTLRLCALARRNPRMLIYFVSSLSSSLLRDTRLPPTTKKPVIIRPIPQIGGKTKQPLRLCALASKTNHTDSLRQFATLVSTPSHPTSTNHKKTVKIRPIRQIRGKTKQTFRLCDLACKTK
jgi:hypothetical protein